MRLGRRRGRPHINVAWRAKKSFAFDQYFETALAHITTYSRDTLPET